MSTKNSTTTSDYLNFDSTLNKSIKIIKTDKNYKLGFLILVGINCGLRISDLLSLKFEDFENDSILLMEKKTNKKRVIKLNDNIKNAFIILKLRIGDINGDSFVFTSNQYGTPHI